jgi:hypothetical protein
MRKSLNLSVVLGLLLLMHSSCEEEHLCDTTDFASPEIVLLEPEDGIVFIPWDGGYPDDISLELEAEAGLNILSLKTPYGDTWPIHAFTQGEKKVVFNLPPEYWEEEFHYVIYDLCNQSAQVAVRVEFEAPPNK